MKQKTIKNKISFSGISLHSNARTNITLLPSEENGIIFKRVDKTENNIIPALYNNVVETTLGTVISNGYEKVSTIEHLMAGIWGCDLDHLIIEIDNLEVPILDGSAKLFIEEIEKAGIRYLHAEKNYLTIEKDFEYIDSDKFIKIQPSDEFSIDLTVDFPYGKIGKQQIKFTGDQEEFRRYFSIARTFCNEKEIEFMQKNGLAKGGTLDNAMVFNENGLVNRNGFRVENEVVRHKLLDLVGDLFTCGSFIKGKITAQKTGHGFNNQFLRELLK